MADRNNEVLVSYAKGACLGNCPVYNIQIFTDGSIVRKESKKDPVKSSISNEELKNLTSLLNSNLKEPAAFKKIRDKPITTLVYKEKKYKYYASSTKGKLMELNQVMEMISTKAIVSKL